MQDLVLCFVVDQKIKIQQAGNDYMPTAMVLCLLELLLQNKAQQQAIPPEKQEEWRAVAMFGYKYLMKLGTSSAVNELAHNTCVFLRNETGLINNKQ
jgi:hypothetical protein